MNDGGPAFPFPADRDANGCGIMEGCSGMSLRDWFAGKALSMLADPDCDRDPSKCSQYAYRVGATAVADAIDLEREIPF